MSTSPNDTDPSAEADSASEPSAASEGAAATSDAASSEGASTAAPAEGQSEEAGASSASNWILLAVLWIAAIAVVAYQAPRIGTQLELRSLRLKISGPKPAVDEEALASLQEKGADILPALAEELGQGGPEREAFRNLITARILGPMKDPRATEMLVALTQDNSFMLRSQAYEVLGNRVEEKLAEKEVVAEVLAECLRDPDVASRTMAARNLVRLGDERGLWPLIDAVRFMPPKGRGLLPQAVAAIQLGLEAPELKLDPTAPPETQIKQILAIESAYKKRGGKIPAGRDLETLLAKQGGGAQASPSPTPKTPEEPTPGASPEPAPSGTPAAGTEQQ